jgi:hypothetical protein
MLRNKLSGGNMRYINMLTFVLCLVQVSSASVIHVPGDSATIQGGINGALTGDTVLVAPGTYIENIVYTGVQITVTGESGAEFTTIQPDNPSIPTVSFIGGEPASTELSGFTISGSEYIAVYCNGSSATIRDNVFTGNNTTEDYRAAAIETENTTDVLITGNIIHGNTASNRYGAAIYVHGTSTSDVIAYNIFYNQSGGNIAIIAQISESVISIHNNTIDVGGNGYGIYNRGTSSEVDLRNNIIFGSGIEAVYTSHEERITAEYNCTFDNNIDYSNLTPGIGNIYDDALFLDPLAHDYRLQNPSPCIDAGDPDPAYNDLDGSRNDMGAVPNFLGELPFARLNFGSEDRLHIVSHNPTFYWDYYDTLGPQVNYIIQVGTDDDWSVAEMWDSGPVNSSDTEAVYAGAPLADGETYYIRNRVDNGVQWGDWDENHFRMNTAPEAPVLSAPIGQEEVASDLVRLYIENSTDAENDVLTYDFEIYSDAGLTGLIASQTAIAEQSGTTISDPFTDFNVDTEYWWRARASDGFEASVWPAAESFITRDSCLVQMPGDADGDGNIDQSDADYIYAYLCQDGPAPYPLANGDPNGDCEINIIDVEFIEAYMYGGDSPVPCTCIDPETIGCALPCDCVPGDPNNDGGISVGDIVYVIAYVFKGGPDPVPYSVCQGDFNGDCQVNVGDAVAGIAYTFKGGPPPVTCNEWRQSCGWPLY